MPGLVIELLSWEQWTASKQLKQEVAVDPPPLPRHHFGYNVDGEWGAGVGMQVKH